MKLLSDTSPEVQQVLDEVYRAMPAWRKWELLDDLYRFGRELHAAGVRQRNPGATAAEIVEDWIAQHVGPVPFRVSQEAVVNQTTEMTRFVREVVTALERLGITYALGGSLASSIHGVNRNTTDADITVEPFPGKEHQLVAFFGVGYYVSLDAVRQAVRERSSFNIISTTTGFKADVFVRKDQPFSLFFCHDAPPPRSCRQITLKRRSKSSARKTSSSSSSNGIAWATRFPTISGRTCSA